MAIEVNSLHIFIHCQGKCKGVPSVGRTLRPVPLNRALYKPSLFREDRPSGSPEVPWRLLFVAM